MSYDVCSDCQNRRSQFFTTAVPLGIVATGAEIACNALAKENRADTFVKTAEKCAKEFTKEGRKDLQWLLKKINWNEAADYIGKVSNKKMFAGVAGAAILANAIFFNLIGKCFNRHD